jgi:hypothetical protein
VLAARARLRPAWSPTPRTIFVGTEQGHDFAGLDREVHAPQRLDIAEPLARRDQLDAGVMAERVRRGRHAWGRKVREVGIRERAVAMAWREAQGVHWG